MKDRTTARVVGGLFIAATVAGALSFPFLQPVTADDYLARASLEPDRVGIGALLVLLMIAAIIAIPIVIYPVLKRGSERLALGYVVTRTIEGVAIGVSMIGIGGLLMLSRDFVDAGSPAASNFQTLGGMLVAVRGWSDAVLSVAAFCLSALILNYALYRTRLVPRWLSVWGLGGAVLYLAGGLIVLFGVEPFSATQNALDAPLALQEMVFAVWLIVKGFDTSASWSVAELERTPVAISG
jgi:hypothetical protein